jgi:branched-chain amino acid transport system substrate-binding protein
VVSSAANSNVVPVVNAWVKYTNSIGGIGGHPVSLDVQNDPGNPGVALTAVKKLVSDGVSAIIETDVGGSDAAWTPYVEQMKIPVYTIAFPTQDMVENPYAFSTAPEPAVIGDMVAGATKRVNSTKIGILYCAESPTCATLPPLVEASAKSQGVQVVTTIKAASTLPSYTAQCLALQSAGVQVLYLEFGSAVDDQVLADCAQQGYNPHAIDLDESLGPSTPGKPGYNGAVGLLDDYPFFLDNTPASQTMHAQLDPTGIFKNPNASGEIVELWTLGLLITAGGEASGVAASQPITPAALLSGMYKLHQTTLGGMTPQLTFTQGKPQLTTEQCWYYVSITSGKLTAPWGTAPSCAPGAGS